MSTPPDCCSILGLVLVSIVQELDPVQQLDDVAISLWRHRIHASYILEEKVLPNEHPIPLRLHRARGIQHLSDLLLL